jgi:hypothetical protein
MAELGQTCELLPVNSNPFPLLSLSLSSQTMPPRLTSGRRVKKLADRTDNLGLDLLLVH